MNEDNLRDIGLTEGESRIYIGLLEIGESSAGDIKKKTKMQNSVVHLCLNNLIEKGLVNYVSKGRRRFYTATDPKHLLDFIEEKRRKIMQIMPLLIEKQKNNLNYQIHIYEGSKGMKAMLEDMLTDMKQGDEYVVLGAPKEAHEKLEPFLLDFHERRQKQKIRMRAIYKKEARQYAEKRRKMKYSSIKYLSKNLDSPMWINVYKNKTLLFVIGDVMIGIVMENQTIADNFKQYFELMWKLAK